eukprot:2447501-Pyramimonas_sp.AAC.1
MSSSPANAGSSGCACAGGGASFAPALPSGAGGGGYGGSPSRVSTRSSTPGSVISITTCAVPAKQINNITSFYGSSCADNGKDALDTPEPNKQINQLPLPHRKK